MKFSCCFFVSRGGGVVTYPSVFRLLLCVDELQSKMASVLIEKLLDFTEEPAATRSASHYIWATAIHVSL